MKFETIKSQNSYLKIYNIYLKYLKYLKYFKYLNGNCIITLIWISQTTN